MRKVVLGLDDNYELEKIGESLASPIRRKILRLVARKSHTLVELANELDFAVSTISFHLKILREAKLIKTIANPSKKGNEKNISINNDTLYIYLNSPSVKSNLLTSTSIRLGSFIDFAITPPCTISTKEKILEPVDSESVFLSPERIDAELVAFYKGYIVYPFKVGGDALTNIASLNFSLELCSECPNYNNDWKSNITFWINDVEVATYLSRGDYGDRPGIQTPDWWPENFTQYGILINITVNKTGTYINGELVANVKIDDLNLIKSSVNRLKIGIKENAKYVGGINLFGSSFGDAKQDIVVTIAYENSDFDELVEAND
ncbi:MAG TPA: helix-turn-helix domain-containing protein [Bacilli bacterium]|nr:helix-turn-helix domain-containing protein [Bacilli bacterium]